MARSGVGTSNSRSAEPYPLSSSLSRPFTTPTVSPAARPSASAQRAIQSGAGTRAVRLVWAERGNDATTQSVQRTSERRLWRLDDRGRAGMAQSCGREDEGSVGRLPPMAEPGNGGYPPCLLSTDPLHASTA